MWCFWVRTPGFYCLCLFVHVSVCTRVEKEITLESISLLFFINCIYNGLKVKLSPKCNLGFFWVKPSCESEKGTFKIDHIFVFGSNSFSVGVLRALASIKIVIFKPLRRLDTTWNFTRSITRVSTHSSTGPHALYPDVSIPEWVVQKRSF